MIKINEELLDKYSAFQGLSHSEISQFIDLIKLKEVKIDENIISEGDAGDSLIFLFKGDVNITKAMTLTTSNSVEDNREKELIKMDHSFYPMFGEMSMFNKDDKRTATITALSNCQIGILSQENFYKVCDENPNIGYVIMKNIGNKLTKDLIKSNKYVLKLTTALGLIFE
tara:strand:+ start:327 stop:836 length:510 start_codon:yes stop_codon:yes gene_type:complete